ncbi:hypothetical protein [Aquiflexum lacus]|uniref:hypothetical protein n=1 Tax=Aquiflexum lacus TaxID=2483805 RepID=UPI001893912F|nr:hypothetical protein [Aquiflexum lacus]
MKPNRHIKINFTSINFLLAFLFIPFLSYSQKQQDIPRPRGPVDLSETSNVVIYLVIPAIIIIVFLIFRKRIGRNKEEKTEGVKKNIDGKNRDS